LFWGFRSAIRGVVVRRVWDPVSSSSCSRNAVYPYLLPYSIASETMPSPTWRYPWVCSLAATQTLLLLFPAYSDVSFGLGHARQLLGCESYAFTLVPHYLYVSHTPPCLGCLLPTWVCTLSRIFLRLVGFATVLHRHLIATRCSSGYRSVFGRDH